jgi:hypothetical protein
VCADHCHYDLQPNLHVQLVGTKRFILFPPEEAAHLYPFPVAHNFDRRAQVDLDAPDPSRYPGCTEARGFVVELRPNEVLYIPPCWWHHVQTCSSPCVSMAWWFFERLKRDGPAERDPSVGIVDRKHFGMARRAQPLAASRWIEEAIAKTVAPIADEEARYGGDVARTKGSLWSGPRQERAAARWVLALAKGSARRLLDKAAAGGGGILSSDLRGVAESLLAEREQSEGAPLPALLEELTYEVVDDALRTHAEKSLGEGGYDEWLVRSMRGRGFGDALGSGA